MYPSRHSGECAEEDQEESIYLKEARAKGVDEDILTAEDDGFMEGYVEGLEAEEEDDFALMDDAPAEEVV